MVWASQGSGSASRRVLGRVGRRITREPFGFIGLILMASGLFILALGWSELTALLVVPLLLGGLVLTLPSLMLLVTVTGVMLLAVGGTHGVDPEFFAVTKRIHNGLYGGPGDGGPLGPEERGDAADRLRGAHMGARPARCVQRARLDHGVQARAQAGAREHEAAAVGSTADGAGAGAAAPGRWDGCGHRRRRAAGGGGGGAGDGGGPGGRQGGARAGRARGRDRALAARARGRRAPARKKSPGRERQ